VDTRPSTVPQVVGAAAENRTRGSQASLNTSAGRAAAALKPPAADDDFDDDGADAAPAGGRSLVRRILVLGALLALLVAGGYGSYRWSQSQYYVGADGQNVAIYRGLSQQVFGMQLSSVHRKTTVPLADLPTTYRDSVKETVQTGSLGEAEQLVKTLQGRAEACARARAAAKPGRTPPPNIPARPTAPATPPKTPSPTPTTPSTQTPGSSGADAAECGTTASG
jgi:PPM family protein phosphatase